ncbi:hypothetical protein BH10PSE17_BH10PSE17_29820 [soil metagenome]
MTQPVGLLRGPTRGTVGPTLAGPPIGPTLVGPAGGWMVELGTLVVDGLGTLVVVGGTPTGPTLAGACGDAGETGDVGVVVVLVHPPGRLGAAAEAGARGADEVAGAVVAPVAAFEVLPP